MGTRLDLHALLIEVLGSRNVYFQPPTSLKMSYPAIVYSRSVNDVRYADDNPYRIIHKYDLVLIEKNPDSAIPDKLANLPRCKLDQCYTADNLYHYAFSIFY